MPNWIHRTTKQILRSVPAAELPGAIGLFIEEPDLSAVEGQPSKYWQITGNTVSLLNQAQRDAVDAQELNDSRDSKNDRAFDDTEGTFRSFALELIDELNELRALHSLAPININSMKSNSRGKFGS